MSKSTFTDHLKAVPLFSGLNDKELDEVASLVTALDFPAGEVLMTEGAYAREMYIVTAGTTEVSIGGEPVTTLSAGDFVGELSLITHSHRSATVTATSPVSVLHIDGPSFSSLLHDIPEIAVKMLPIVAERAQNVGAAQQVD